MDFAWRAVYLNNKINMYFDDTVDRQGYVEKHFPTIIDLALDKNYKLNKTTTPEESESRRRYLLRMLIHYQYDQVSRTKEKWYLDTIRHLMDNELFRELWPLAQKQSLMELDVLKFANKMLTVGNKENKKELSFYLFIIPILGDPRFSVQFDVPANKEAFDYAQNKLTSL